jgi:hypothetical protein
MGLRAAFDSPPGLELRFSGSQIRILATILTGQLRFMLHVQPDVTSRYGAGKLVR